MSENEWLLSRRQLVALLGATAGAAALPVWAQTAQEIAPQPYFASVRRVLAALEALGSPISAADARQIESLALQSDSAAVAAADDILDRYTLARVVTDEDGYAHATAAGANKTLIEQGWSVFLVRVANPIASTDTLSMSGPGLMLPGRSTTAARAGLQDTLFPAPAIARAWLASRMYSAPPMSPGLSGAPVEYRVVQLYSRDRGRRATTVAFFTSTHRFAEYIASLKRRGSRMEFDCLPSSDVLLRVRDADGRGCVASLTIQDKFGRVYPLQAMRLAPDMYFQSQIYRADGETVRLPEGEYTIESKRGPEYLRGMQTVVINEGRRQIEVQLQRWIDPAKWGWYSGDPHIHGGGCSHYEHPTEGVSPETMIRQVRGEALTIGEVLSWGPSWYYQKQFFTGRAISPPATLEHPELQAANNASLRPQPTPEDSESLLRYDVEVSGFPSSHCGHLILLRAQEQDYPGTKIIQDWPSWNLPILKWARAQGAVAGVAHCGSGMVVESTELPNYEIPAMDGIGTQEAIVDVAHGYVDFIAGCNGQPASELNAWYHMLNCGFRLAFVGETDYPCITDDRPGMGRSYVRLDDRPVDDAGYEAWIRNLRKGKLYSGDGRSHFLDFKVNGRSSGEEDLVLKAVASVTVEALVAARLEPEPSKIALMEDNGGLMGWHLERARIGTSREVLVELLVNGIAVEKRGLIADGKPRPVRFNASIARSSWVALRIYPSAHTHPVFVRVGGKPVRGSRRSAQWCRDCVDKLWVAKSPGMRESERAAAREAFDHARAVYERIASESDVP